VLPAGSATAPSGQILATVSAIVMVTDPDREAAIDPTLVRDLLGLTLGEARIAVVVGSGVGPRETAKRLGISENTVRSVRCCQSNSNLSPL
jgi:DNA-binding NarL/FixJ family response regulator